MKGLNARVAIETTADKNRLEIDVDQFRRDTVREIQLLVRCCRDNRDTPVTMDTVDL